MAVLGSSYSVSRASGVCAATQRPFTPDEVFVAALIETPGSGLSRLDYSVDAWNAGARPPSPAAVVGFWKSHFHPNPQAKKNLLDDAELLELFDNLTGTSDAKQIRFRYMLALLLIRRRVIRVVATKRTKEGTVMSIYRRGETADKGPPSEVIDPGLDDISIADAMEQLAQLMDTDARSENPQTITPAKPAQTEASAG
jgi:hypothetical protein